ncbi:MAG: ferritin family protein [Candidatus Omnitrophota bacterium]
MPKIFNAAEIADLGIEKEKKRRDFYALVASSFKDSEMKKLFSRLRDWEEEHIKKFTQIRNEIRETEPVESYPGELATYMQSLVDDLLYNKVSAQAFSKNVTSSLVAIDFAIGFEKDAILFFLEMLSYMNSSQKEIVQTLINEEKQHVVYLSQLRKDINNRKK